MDEKTQNLTKYREIRAKNNPTGFGCVYLNSDGSVETGMCILEQFSSRAKGEIALIAAGYKKGGCDAFYV